MIHAIVYVPANGLDRGARAIEFCQQQEWDVTGIVHNNLAAAIRMLVDRQADALVVDSEADLIQEQRPRIVVVASQPTPRGERRSRIIRRTAEE